MDAFKMRVSLLTLCIALTPLVASAEELDAAALLTKAYELPRVDDQISTLTFTISEPDKSDEHLVYTMVWKDMKGEGGYEDKAMFFTERPPERHGTIYLGWLRSDESSEPNDEWIYLPELHMIRRIAQRDRHHAHDDDEFGRSLLTHDYLDPPPVESEEHSVMGEELFNNRPHLLIVSHPKQLPGVAAKTVRWIDKESNRIDRTQFFNTKDEETLDMQVEWTQLHGYWIWQRVTAVDPRNQAMTTMEISKIRINNGLTDKEFSRRTLNNWPNNFH